MFIKKYGDIVVSVFFMLLSAVMMILASQLPKSTVMDIGPDFMPMIIGVVTFAIALILLIVSIRKLKTVEITEEKEDADYKRVLLSFASVLVYVFILQPVGFIISTIIYLPIQMYILAKNEQRSKKDVLILCVISVIFTIVVYALFRYGFKIVLPGGFLRF